MIYRIGIVGHTARVDAVHVLQDKVGAVYASVDDGTLGCDANHNKVWTWLADNPADADWLVVIEDDALPITEFADQLTQVLEAAPTPIVSLYLGTGRPVWYQPKGQSSAKKLQPILREAVAKAEVQGSSFITAPQLFHGVAVAIKTDLVPSMLDMTGLKDERRPFDYAISDWGEHEELRISYPQPSLVDHEDGPSVAVHQDREPRTTERKAYRTGGRNTWSSDRIVEL